MSRFSAPPAPRPEGAAALLATLCALLGACSSGEVAPRGEIPRNLVLISIDTLRADRLGCYGYDRPTSPCLDELAAAGVLFEDASAPSPWTMPSHASLFTGLYPSHNGVISMRHGMAEGVEHVASILARAGFETAAVVSNSLLTAKGLETGFGYLEEADHGGPHPSAVSRRAAHWLRARVDSSPFFLLVHYIDPHSDYVTLPEFGQPFLEPYDGPATGSSDQLFEFVRGALELDATDARHLSNLYDGAVRQLDQEIRSLHDVLAQEGLLGNTLIVVTSDHGEEFFEHGGLLHGQTQFEEVLRVPLLVSGPGVPAGVAVSAPVSLVDVLPTVLDQLEVAAPEGLDGVSLRAAWHGEPLPARHLYFEADLDPPTPGTGILSKGTDRAIRDERFKLHFDRRTKTVRLYDLALDPLEQRDVQAEHPERAAQLLAELKRFLKSGRAAPAKDLSDEDLERLRELGYAGDG